ncbi:unnamed protein product, partial [Musa acuminata subsp. burmannicoides]
SICVSPSTTEPNRDPISTGRRRKPCSRIPKRGSTADAPLTTSYASEAIAFGWHRGILRLLEQREGDEEKGVPNFCPAGTEAGSREKLSTWACGDVRIFSEMLLPSSQTTM